jgi:hypothetical protein
VFRCVLRSEGCVLVPRSSGTPVATWAWPTWVVSRRRVLEAVFILLEFPSPLRRIFIGSHSLPPLWFAVSVLHRGDAWCNVERRGAIYSRSKADRGRYFRRGAHWRRRCSGGAVVAGRNPGRRATGRLGQRAIKAAAVVGWQPSGLFRRAVLGGARC